VVAGALVALWLAVGSALALFLGWPVRTWSVMPDEMLYAKLATSIAETGSPLPRVHETPGSVSNILYPLLLAPLYAAFSAPDAFRAAHILNAFVMASAAFPAYLLAREVLERGWSFLVAALSITVPWMVLTGFLMTESVAYPAFLWAVLALHQAIDRPSRRGDLLAVAAIGFAVLARTQFFVLLAVLPLAIAGHEIGRALLGPDATPRRRKALAGAAEAVSRHRALLVLYALGVVTALALALVAERSVTGVLGSYDVTLEKGSVLPWSTWGAAVRHVDAVALGVGLIPLVLGGGWMLANVVRPLSDRERALASLSLVTVVLLAVEVGSFSARFEGVDPSAELRDRYAFYVAPLLFLGTVAALTRGPRRGVAIGAGLVTLFFAATAWHLPFGTNIFADSPANVVNLYLIQLSPGAPTGLVVALAGLVVGVVATSVLLLPRIVGAVVTVEVLAAFSLLVLYDAVDLVRARPSLPDRHVTASPGSNLDWVDSALPAGATAAVVAFPGSGSWWPSAIAWWDVEFWNTSVAHALVSSDGNFSYTAWARRTLTVDWESGAVADTTGAPAYVVVDPRDPRFLLAGEARAARRGLVVRSADRPYRAVWATRGLDGDGWGRPGRPAAIRVFPVSDRTAHVARVRLSIRAPDSHAARYSITVSGDVRAGQLAGGELRRIVLPLCVPTYSPADVTFTAWSNARIAELPLSPTVVETRRVGARFGPISVAHTRRDCRPTPRN
jgi:hypothetical protein